MSWSEPRADVIQTHDGAPFAERRDERREDRAIDAALVELFGRRVGRRDDDATELKHPLEHALEHERVCDVDELHLVEADDGDSAWMAAATAARGPRLRLERRGACDARLGHELVEMDAARARGEARWQGGVERVHQHRLTTADAAVEVDALGEEGRGGVREVGGDESVAAERLELAKRDRLSRVAVDEIPGANATLELANGTVDRGGIEAARLGAVLRLLGRAEGRRGEATPSVAAPATAPVARAHDRRAHTATCRRQRRRPRYRRKGTRDEPLKHASGRGDALRAAPSCPRWSECGRATDEEQNATCGASTRDNALALFIGICIIRGKNSIPILCFLPTAAHVSK